MASSVDIVPALGHGLITSQSGPSAGYDAIDDRRFWSVGLQEGAITAGSYEVTQRGVGANMTVDVAAHVGDGALVQGDSVVAQGLYRVPPTPAAVNVDITAANATNPRVDLVVLEIKDDEHDVSTLNVARVRVVTGTATAGATLTNRTGAPALPTSCLLLADVLVGAAAATVTNTVIRDRRTWARGAYVRIVRNANAAASSDYTSPASTTAALIDGTNLAPRVECSGGPVRATLTGVFSAPVAATLLYSPQVDSVGVDGMGSVGAAISSGLSHDFDTNNLNQMMSFAWTFLPSAGSHIIAPAWARIIGDITLFARAATPVLWIVEEIVRQNTKNNATTSG